MSDILIINGPNLNMLGKREPSIYGYETLDDINQKLQDIACQQAIKCAFFQSNSESELIEKIHELVDDSTTKALIINPGAYSHTSIALADALSMLSIPIYEVHISNIHKRETFRHHSYVSSIAKNVICGYGHKGYEIALQNIIDML